MAEIFGWSEEEMTSRTVYDFIVPEDHALMREDMRNRISGAVGSSHYYLRMLHQSGSVLQIELHASRMDHNGSPAVMGTLLDITARKAAEERLATATKVLQTSEERYRRLIEFSPDAILVGRNHVIDIANRAAIELFGVSSAEDLIGRRLADIVGPKARNQAEELTRRLHEHEVQLPLEEMQICRSDGLQLDVEYAASSVEEDGKMVILLIGRNITERKQAEAEHAQLIRSIEQVEESIIITDLEGTTLYVNPAFEKVTGYARDEVIGSNTRLLRKGEHPASFY
jgi:PAS domain S-box-containing protein